MKIKRIELYHVAMPLIRPWRTACGEESAVHSVLCRMTSGSVAGWGESSPLAAPCYSPEWAAAVFLTLRDWLGPALLGADISTPQQLADRLAIFKGNPFAKAALDMAWWSLFCHRTDKPLHVALSEEAGLGAPRNEVPVGADFGILDKLDDLLSCVGEAVDAGFPRIKLKFGPGWEIPVLRAVRKQHPDHVIHIDCNSAYRISDLSLFQEIDQFRLSMIEQPLQHDDLIDHGRLQAQIKTPVCLDESITHPRRAEQAMELNSCRYVNVKPGRVGGLTNAVAIHNICRSANVPCWVGGMLESATGAAQCAALAMLDNFTYPADVFPSSRFYHEDLSDPPLELHASAKGEPSIAAPLRLPAPVPERLAKRTVQTAVLR